MNGPDHVGIRCPAKLNLFLEVLSRRPDNYHDIATVFLKVGLFDTLLVARAPDGIRIAVEGADLPEGEGNLVHAAATTFRGRFPFAGGLRIRLVKRIPLMAGLGGGSSDAAGMLRALRDLLRPELTAADLLPLAVALGSDVPFFLGGPAALGEGRGERLSPVRAPTPRWTVLFFPGFGLSTARVYGAVRVPPAADRRSPQPLLAALRESPDADLAPFLHNRLAEAAARVEPRVEGVSARLSAALLPGEACLLTGSGSTFFAPVKDFDRAVALREDWSRIPEGRSLVVSTLAEQHSYR